MTQQQKELLSQFGRSFPKCAALPILPVPTKDGKGFQEGYDMDDVQGALGATRFAVLTTLYVKAVFCCGHRNWPGSHAEVTKRGAEVYCVYASDLEKFLKDGN